MRSDVDPLSLSPNRFAAGGMTSDVTSFSSPCPPSGSVQSMSPEYTVRPSSLIDESSAEKWPPGSLVVGGVTTNFWPKSGNEMPLSLIAAVVSNCPDELRVKQPSVVNSESANASRLKHSGGGGGGGWSGVGSTTPSVRVTIVSCSGDALSRMRA